MPGQCILATRPVVPVGSRRETRHGRLGAVVAVVIGVRRTFAEKSHIGVIGVRRISLFSSDAEEIRKLMLKSVPRSASTWKSKNQQFREIRRFLMESKWNDLTERMALLIEPETYQERGHLSMSVFDLIFESFPLSHTLHPPHSCPH